jgi:hypothetical protein
MTSNIPHYHPLLFLISLICSMIEPKSKKKEKDKENESINECDNEEEDDDNEEEEEMVGVYLIDREEEISENEKDLSIALKCGSRSDVPSSHRERVGIPLSSTNIGHQMLLRMGYVVCYVGCHVKGSIVMFLVNFLLLVGMVVVLVR